MPGFGQSMTPAQSELEELMRRVAEQKQVSEGREAGGFGGKLAAGVGGFFGFNEQGQSGLPGAFQGVQALAARRAEPALRRAEEARRAEQQRNIADLEGTLSPQERALLRVAPDKFLPKFAERFGQPLKVGQGEALFGPAQGGGVEALGGVDDTFSEGDDLYQFDPTTNELTHLGRRGPTFAEAEAARRNRSDEGLRSRALAVDDRIRSGQLSLAEAAQAEKEQRGQLTKQPTAAQEKARLDYERLRSANATLSGLAGPNGKPYQPSILSDVLGGVPFVGSQLRAATSGTAGQAAKLASGTVADVAVRTHSGGAATNDEVALYEGILTPRSTDTRETLMLKARLRAEFEESKRVAAGYDAGDRPSASTSSAAPPAAPRTVVDINGRRIN